MLEKRVVISDINIFCRHSHRIFHVIVYGEITGRHFPLLRLYADDGADDEDDYSEEEMKVVVVSC